MHLTAAQLRKAITALLATLTGAIGEAIDWGLFHGTAARAAGIAIGFITTVAATYGVYLVPNEPNPSSTTSSPTLPPPGATATGTTTAGGAGPTIAGGAS